MVFLTWDWQGGCHLVWKTVVLLGKGARNGVKAKLDETKSLMFQLLIPRPHQKEFDCERDQGIPTRPKFRNLVTSEMEEFFL